MAEFTDLDGLSQEARDAIIRLAEQGFLKGTSATTFDPYAPVTRWQVALLFDRHINPVPREAFLNFDGSGTSQERQIVVDAFNESTYPWERVASVAYPLNIRFMENIAATGSAGGMTLPTNNISYLDGSIRHELGHVLAGRLLQWEHRELFLNRTCPDVPRHGWFTTNATPYVYAGTENFANAYAWAFHNGYGQPGMGHIFSEADQAWFPGWVLSLGI
jgi:hypothetical protein